MLPGGRAGLGHADEWLCRKGIRLLSFFEAFNAATADRVGVPLHVVLTIHAVSTYLPVVPSHGHTFDFEIEPAREASSMSAPECRRPGGSAGN